MQSTKRLLVRQQNEVTLRLISKLKRFSYSRTITHHCLRYGRSLVHFDPALETKLRWKLDLYIVPTVSLLYLFCFIDRANIGR